MPLLELDRVRFSFGEERVIEDVSLRIERGGFVSILGASGCGKSTLLRIMAGLAQPTDGEIRFVPDWELTNGAGDVSTNASFVFQKPTLCPWLTVQQNIELPNRLQQISKQVRTKNALEAIRLVGLSELDKNKLPNQLSGGMQMRVSLARAIVTKPSLILMDEPFSALDEVLRQQLTETCLELWRRESWTTVFVTHNVAESVFLSQRIHILAGKPATIVDTIDVPFVDRTRELRASAEFQKLVANVSQRLRVAVESKQAPKVVA